jgi:hypothetical protein
MSLGREGKQQVKFHRDRKPYSAAMGVQAANRRAKIPYCKRKWIAEPPNGWMACTASMPSGDSFVRH